ncbi:DegT/DnrJ/EryC1/StrS family aminotransferase [Flavisolibacter tropicus]|uniref:Erythromycin biosynthesis sensory transduction protein eryC1 n=1 Tax=Flavisolibacter tropicus TaxID=1492898 RepID=A0A172TQE2_9BACT|nr:DegT/DnrJ/EryC1/StrS family aminotransferase [Flavisolibacter tropicus]ANE49250.1 erythromycin biosynthesis sensory transduction protein eryC1 [Flavisolibacter tropicus]
MHYIDTKAGINCLDLYGQHQQIKKEVFEAFEKVYDNTAFSGGYFVEEFEKSFAQFCHTQYAVGLNNGTSALHLAMLVLGIGPGDEVIVPANTFIATAWGVSYSGAKPVFVDCTSDTWQIDPTKIESKINSRTKAIIGVHLYGQPFDIESVTAICKKYNLFLVEDAAQAQGAIFKDKPVGSFGEVGCFSFYPGKNLGACGEAGGIVTNDEGYYKHLLRLRNHGAHIRYHHDELGFNMRMGGLEGASLQIKLKYLQGWNNRRREIARRYQHEIVNEQIRWQKQPLWAQSVYHLFVITTNDKEELISYLNRHHIYPGLHYPVPCHLQKAYKHLGYQLGDCPNAEFLAGHCLSLPMYAELSDSEVSYIIDMINRY